MASTSKTIIINAPIKEVYEWVEYAPNFIGVWPNLLKTVNYTRDENNFGLHETIYMMAGIQVKVNAQDTVKIPQEKIIAESTGPLTSVVTWEFEKTAEGATKLTFSVEYSVPFKALSGLTEGIIIRLNNSDMIVLLANLKNKLEDLYGNLV